MRLCRRGRRQRFGLNPRRRRPSLDIGLVRIRLPLIALVVTRVLILRVARRRRLLAAARHRRRRPWRRAEERLERIEELRGCRNTAREHRAGDERGGGA